MRRFFVEIEVRKRGEEREGVGGKGEAKGKRMRKDKKIENRAIKNRKI